METVATFPGRLGFVEYFRMTGPDGVIGFTGLRRTGAELAVTTDDSPRALAGVEPGPGPRQELFVYLEDADRPIAELRTAARASSVTRLTSRAASASALSPIVKGTSSRSLRREHRRRNGDGGAARVNAE